MPLGQLGAPIKHACVGGPFGSELTRKDYCDSGVPVIRGANLNEEAGFVDDGFVFVSSEKANSLRQNLATRGDVIFTQRGTIGQVAVIPAYARHETYLISQSQMKLTPDPRRVEARYIVHFFRSPTALRFLERNTLATGVPHINLSILRRVPVPLPPLP
ncbi:MAG: restriction endonuclease subunit S [Polyangiaceae bacterium]